MNNYEYLVSQRGEGGKRINNEDKETGILSGTK